MTGNSDKVKSKKWITHTHDTAYKTYKIALPQKLPKHKLLSLYWPKGKYQVFHKNKRDL